jgi:snurportin-1
MDDSLLHQFHGFFSVGGDVNAPTRPHPTFSSLYKHKRAGFGEQETRRRRLLEEQRSRRRDHADYVRRIAEGEEWEEEMGEEELEEEIDPDQVDDASAADADVKESEKKKRRVHPYRNQLMMSEWLVDVPPDFTDNWFMTVCPVGRRCLVIANKRTTLAYSRIGAFINCFPSLLPGGYIRTCNVLPRVRPPQRSL